MGEESGGRGATQRESSRRAGEEVVHRRRARLEKKATSWAGRAAQRESSTGDLGSKRASFIRGSQAADGRPLNERRTNGGQTLSRKVHITFHSCYLRPMMISCTTSSR